MNVTYRDIQDILSDKLSVDIVDIKPQSNLIEELGADSLDLVDILMEAEERYDLSIPDNEAEKLYTPQSIFDYVKNNYKGDGD